MPLFSRNKPTKDISVPATLSSLPRTCFLAGKRNNEFAVVLVIPMLFGLWGALSFYQIDQGVVRAPIRVADRTVSVDQKEADVSSAYVLEGLEVNIIDNAVANSKREKLKKTAVTTKGCVRDRATIVDRQGAILAASVQKAQLYFYRNVYRFRDDAERLALAKKIVEIVPTKKSSDIMRVLSKPKGHFFVAEGLSPQQVSSLKDNIDDRYSGMINIEIEDSRIYPKGELFTHAIGSLKADFCPVSGLEKSLNNTIVSGSDTVKVSLDESIQYILVDELTQGIERTGAESATAMVMDMHTGHVLGHVSLPTYDVNQKTYLSNHHKEEFARLDKDLVSGSYEFGSVFKIFNTALALEGGIGLYERFKTKRPLYYGGYPINEDHPEPFDLNMLGIFLRSNNRGSAIMAVRAGHAKQVELLDRLGLADPKELNKPAMKSLSGVATRSYGYGVAITMSQLAVATSSLLNGGILVRPEYDLHATGRTNERVFSKDNSNILGRMMLTNVTNFKGTGKGGYRAGVILGLKTGTSKVHVAKTDTKEAHYIDDTRATVVGAFPMDNPRYVVVASLLKPYDSKGKPMNAGSATAPVVGNIAERIAIREGLLRTAEFAKQYEDNHALSYQHQPYGSSKNDMVRIAQN